MAENVGFISNTSLGLRDEYSKPISITEANTIVGRVEGRTSPIILQSEPDDETGLRKNILGFSFDREDLMMALGNEDDADGIYLAIAERVAGDLGSQDSGYTLVLYGTRDGHVIHDDNRIFDYSKPCPCNCPRIGETC